MTDYHYITENIKNNQDNQFYSQIFNIITKNDKVKNYINNNNGIFFDYNKVEADTIMTVVEFIKSYNRKKEEKDKYETERHEIISKNDKIYNNTMSKLSKDIENSILHTQIDEEFSDEEMIDNTVVEDNTEIDYKELFGDSDDE